MEGWEVENVTKQFEEWIGDNRVLVSHLMKKASGRSYSQKMQEMRYMLKQMGYNIPMRRYDRRDYEEA